VKVIENFLDKNDFLNLENYLLEKELAWYYRDSTVVNGDDVSYFTHSFFNEDTINSTSFNLVKPILNKLNYSSIIQIRANLILRNETSKKTGWHIDYNYKNHKTAIFYINESNGPTIFKNKKLKIFPKKNKILIMDGNTEHALYTQTDTKRRVVININYYEK
tara:strand:- start:333 stop:818 length:486 start_codon:yes stop_codon:yes gene_type:complete